MERGELETLTNQHHTHRPEAVATHSGALEVLVYVRHHCSVSRLPESGTLRFGRSPSSDVRIEDQSVSRFHFALHLGNTIEVEDLGSANGTSLFRADTPGVRDAGAAPVEAEARLAPGERRTLNPGDFVRAGIALVMVQTRIEPERSAVSSRPPADLRAPVLLDPQMKSVHEVAVRAARSGISVLITGETGAGKEILAETIHTHSDRCTRPLLRLNCAALSATLLESELFGHERGAFTGAIQPKAGLLEANDRGTIFLDEIGEMPLSTQAKLLRVLEEMTVLRVGATRPRPIDVRFIWATNRDLRAEAHRGNFRHDLYYRIAGVELTLPPLRKRIAEIEPLARFFLERFCRRLHLPLPSLTPEALDALRHYSWPGNVRELKNVMERAPLVSAGSLITAEHIPTDCDRDNGFFAPEEMEATAVVRLPSRAAGVSAAALREAPPSGLRAADPASERARITLALEQCAGNQTRAARLLGFSRRTLITRLESLNMPRPKKG